MLDQSELITGQVQEWIATLELICRSQEIKNLVKRLEEEHGAYPQTIVKIEEE